VHCTATALFGASIFFGLTMFGGKNVVDLTIKDCANGEDLLI